MMSRKTSINIISKLKKDIKRNITIANGIQRRKISKKLPLAALSVPLGLGIDFLTKKYFTISNDVADVLEPPHTSKILVNDDIPSDGIVKKAVKAAVNVLKELKRYFGMLKRFLWCSTVLGTAAAATPLALLLGKEEDYWEFIVYIIEMLGPSFIKLAQWASTRPDLFPRSLTCKLIKLQDSTRTHPWSTAEATLDLAFGKEWREILEIDQSKPIGSGCIAQVYRGKYLDKNDKGEIKDKVDVAIKLIHPHIEQNLIYDMHLMKAFIWLIEFFPGIHYMSLSDTANTFARAMQEQMDLRIEAENMNHFIDDFRDSKTVLFSKPLEGLIQKHALVETFCNGVPITNFMSEDTDPKFKFDLSRLCCYSMLDMVFTHNFVHGDLHPGNILVNLDNPKQPKLVFLDCGIVTKIEEKEHGAFVDICLALLNYNGHLAGELMLQNAGRESDIAAKEGFCRGIQEIVEIAKQEDFFEHIGKYILQICDLSCQFRVKLVHEYLNVAMAVKVCEGISLTLDPSLELAKVAIPTVLKAQGQILMRKGFGLDSLSRKKGEIKYLSRN